MRTIYILFAFIFFITSCDNSTKQYYYPNGKIYYIDYFDNKDMLRNREVFSLQGSMVSDIRYSDNKFLNAKMYYNKELIADIEKYKNGKVKAKIYSRDDNAYGLGKIDYLGRQIGWWTFFNKSKKIIGKKYFLIYGYDSTPTQQIKYKNGKVDSLKIQLANLSFRKQEPIYKGKLTYTRKLNSKSYVSIIMSSDINSNFTNESEVVFDTIGFGDKALMEFPIIFETEGEKTIKGYIIEQYLNSNDEMNEVRTPFEKTLTIIK